MPSSTPNVHARPPRGSPFRVPVPVCVCVCVPVCVSVCLLSRRLWPRPPTKGRRCSTLWSAASSSELSHPFSLSPLCVHVCIYVCVCLCVCACALKACMHARNPSSHSPPFLRPLLIGAQSPRTLPPERFPVRYRPLLPLHNRCHTRARTHTHTCR